MIPDLLYKKEAGNDILPLYRKLLFFLFRVKDLASAVGSAVRAGVMSLARLAALRAGHQLRQGQMMM
jgi:hypothetical protein